MYTNNIVIENFISFCDDMMIANEANNKNIFQRIRDGFISFFTMIINSLSKLISKFKNNKTKKSILAATNQAKEGLNKSKKIDDTTTEEEINEIREIQEKVQEEVEIIKTNIDQDNMKNETINTLTQDTLENIDNKTNDQAKKYKKFDPSKFKAPVSRNNKFDQVIKDHGYYHYNKNFAQRVNGGVIVLKKIGNNDPFSKDDITSNPGESAKDFLERIGWL